MPRLRPPPETDKKPPLTENSTAFEVKVAPQEETVVLVEDEKKPDEATLALQKQIADLKKSEEVQRNLADQMRREREDALRQARENSAKFEQAEKEGREREELAVGSALAAAKAEADKAQSDYAIAMEAGNFAAAAEAQRRLSVAASRMDRLELGKEELEQRKKALAEKKPEPEQRPQNNTGDPIDSWNLPNDCKDWLRGHREYISNPEKAAELEYVHRKLTFRGIQPGNSTYLAQIEQGLQDIGSMPKPDAGTTEDPEIRREETRKSSIMSAPVSRETHAADGKRKSTQVSLTKEEQEFARIAGVTDVEYAKQKQRLADEKTGGNYGERRYG